MSSNDASNRAADISSIWRRIARWIAMHAPAWADADGPSPLFQPPATGEEVEQLEAHLELELPDQLRTLLLTSNGCRQGDYPLPMRPTRPTKWRTTSVTEIAAEWDLLSSIADKHPFRSAVRAIGPVQTVWWSRRWIPIAECGMGDVVCADMKPARGGSAGQLILYEHDFEERKVLYPSLLDWLRECAGELERGEYVYIDGVGLLRKDETNG